MESRIIYKKSEHLISKVEWAWNDNTGWIYCGLSEDFKDDLVSEHLAEHFAGSTLYLVTTRTGSCQLSGEEAIHKIKGLIDVHGFCIWNTAFTKVIEFNSIGVFRKGVCAA